MSKLVAMVTTGDEDDIIDHFDGTPEEFAEKYSGFAFDDCQFFSAVFIIIERLWSKGHRILLSEKFIQTSSRITDVLIG